MTAALPDQLPDGTYAEWQGRTWRASTGPAGTVLVFADRQEDPQFTPTPAGGWRRPVPSSEATVFRLTTHGRWRDEDFVVEGRSPDGRLDLAWTGTDSRRATELGLTQVDRASWSTVAPESEVTDLRQERRDLPRN